MHPSLQGQHGGMLQCGEGFRGAGGKTGLAMSCGTPDDAGSGGFESAQRQHAPAWLVFLFCFLKKQVFIELGTLLPVQLWL